MKSHDNETEHAKREWDAQERAVREERAGARQGDRTAARSSPHVGIYRLVVRALKQPPLDPIPTDFAALTAARIEAESGTADFVETWLERGLVVLLIFVGAGAVLSYNAEFLSGYVESLRALLSAVPRVPQATDIALPPFGVWGLAIAACVGFTWLFESWQKWERP
jgi:hypothetical protein